MFQYRIQEQLFASDTLQIYNGLIKDTKEEIEITAIKRDVYKHSAAKVELEKYLKSMRDILILIDIFPSKIFPTKTNAEWLVIVESKKYYSLTDFIVNNMEIDNSTRRNIDILLLIYELISVLLTFSNFESEHSEHSDDDEDDIDANNDCYQYGRFIPQNVFISEFNEVFLKFPYWLLLEEHDNGNTMRSLNFSQSYRYYVPPHLLFVIANQQKHQASTERAESYQVDLRLYSKSHQSLLCNVDIWCLGCCIAEIFYGIPLFSSVNISDQLLKMFQILGYPDWKQIPWKYWKIEQHFKDSIQRQQHQAARHAKRESHDLLDKIINNAAIVDLLRCCLQYTSKQQISLNQLSVFVDMFEINNKSENKQHRLTFDDAQWRNNNHQENVVLVGSSTFIEEWCLLPPQKAKGVKIDQTKTERALVQKAQSPPAKSASHDDMKQEQLVPDEREQTERKQQLLEQRGCQTTKIETNDSSVNTEKIKIVEVGQEDKQEQETKDETSDEIEELHERMQQDLQLIEDNVNITDCIRILPFSEKFAAKKQAQSDCNLLIIEFSNICNTDNLNVTDNESCSFQCRFNKNHGQPCMLISSPIFNIENLKQCNKQRQKVYIHVMLSAEQCQYILHGTKVNSEQHSALDTLHIQFVAHRKWNKCQETLGEISIDIGFLGEYKIIEGYYHIFPIKYEQKGETKKNGKRKLGQVYIRVLPQFNISTEEVEKITMHSDCNESTITDDQSLVSNEAWQLFNKFVTNQT